MSCLIEEPHIPGYGSAEVFAKGPFAHDVDLCPEGLLQFSVESAHFEKTHAFRGLYAEIVVAVRAVVPAGSGAEEIYSQDSVLGGYGPDYITELLERVLFRLAHDNRMVFSLYKQGLGPDCRPLLSIPRTRYRWLIFESMVID